MGFCMPNMELWHIRFFYRIKFVTYIKLCQLRDSTQPSFTCSKVTIETRCENMFNILCYIYNAIKKYVIYIYNAIGDIYLYIIYVSYIYIYIYIYIYMLHVHDLDDLLKFLKFKSRHVFFFSCI